MNRTEQVERLLSERPDGALTAEESAEVRRAIAGDSRAAAAARQYERLHRLLADWRALPADVDWEAFRLAASARVAGEAVGARRDSRTSDGRLAATQRGAANVAGDAVDRLVRRAAGDVPAVDWVALKSRISAAVQREALQTRHEGQVVPARWRRAMTWTGRVGLPLAAAAAIALLVWLPQTGGDRSRGRADGLKSPIVVVSLEAPQSEGQVTVTFEGMPTGGAGRAEIGVRFDETAATAAPESPAGGMAIVVRSSAGAAGGGAAESFDDSPLY